MLVSVQIGTPQLLRGTPLNVIVALIQIVGLLCFGYIVAKRLAPLLHGQRDPRLGRPWMRVQRVVKFWFGQWKHPRYRLAGTLHLFIFAGFLILAVYKLSHFRNVPLLRNLLVGPIFEFWMFALSGIAAWTIWKAHPSARGWAIIASVTFIFIFIRPFLIPMPPVLEHNLIALVVGLIGISAFTWPDPKS